MINIRKAELKDASDYAHILNQSWKDTYGSYVSYEHIDDEFNIDKLIEEFPDVVNSNSTETYIMEYDNKSAGVLSLGVPEDKYKDNMDGIGEIITLHIKKEYQGKHIGTSAILFAENRLKELRYQKICVWVKIQNIKAINFYKKQGFIETKYKCLNTVDGAPSMVMEKN